MRSNPAIRRALERRAHSRSVFAAGVDDDDADAMDGGVSGAGDDMVTRTVHNTVWEAARACNLEEVKRLVAETHLDLRAHDNDCGGRTLLHHACWQGNIAFAWYVLDSIGRGFGRQEVEALANARDSAYSQTTPLMMLCRTTQGDMLDRVELMDLLLSKGADPLLSDRYADTCLHWAVRRHATPLVRHLLKNSNNALFLVNERNAKGLSPMDIAEREADKEWRVNDACRRRRNRSDHCDTCDVVHPSEPHMVDLYNLLQDVAKGAGMRLKLMRNAEIRREGVTRLNAMRAAKATALLRASAVLIERTHALKHAHRRQAEATRAAGEAKALDAAAVAAEREAEEWLESGEGIDWERSEVKKAAKDLRLSGRKVTKKVRRELATKARQGYITERVRISGIRALRAYRSQHAPNFECPVVGCRATFIDEGPFLQHQQTCTGELDDVVVEQQELARQNHENLMDTAWAHVKADRRERLKKLETIRNAAKKKQQDLEAMAAASLPTKDPRLR